MGLNEQIARDGFVTTRIEWLIAWAQKNSLWPMPMGISCCAIEMMAAGASRFDMDRFGSGIFRATPRQSDLMIVAGRLSRKMAPAMRRVYDQMPEPKWVISMGACASVGGAFLSAACAEENITAAKMARQVAIRMVSILMVGRQAEDHDRPLSS